MYIYQRKYNRRITILLINAHLLKMADFDVHLSKKMDNGKNKAAVEFAIYMIKKCMLELETPAVTPTELFNTLEVLEKLLRRPGAPEGYGMHVCSVISYHPPHCACYSMLFFRSHSSSLPCRLAELLASAKAVTPAPPRYRPPTHV